MTLELSLPGFEGPVDALQTMVTAHPLAVDDLPLASIPAQFLADTANRDTVDLDLAGEVLSTVARLMLLKSIHLLAQPAEDEEDESHEPHARSDMPALREAALSLTRQQGHAAYAASGAFSGLSRKTRPRSARILVQAWTQMHLREGGRTLRAAVPRFVRLEVAISRLINQLRTGQPIRLTSFLRGESARDVVMHFLAMLELVRRGQAVAQQEGSFEEISIEWADIGDQGRSRAG